MNLVVYFRNLYTLASSIKLAINLIGTSEGAQLSGAIFWTWLGNFNLGSEGLRHKGARSAWPVKLQISWFHQKNGVRDRWFYEQNYSLKDVLLESVKYMLTFL